MVKTGMPYLSETEQRQLQPLDVVLTPLEKKSIHFVAETFAEDMPREKWPALILAAHHAEQVNLPLHIITRGAQGDPMMYRKILSSKNIAGPNRVSFYSDAARDKNGHSRTRPGQAAAY